MTSPRVRQLGVCPYSQSWQQMREYTNKRNSHSADEIWCLQHPAVFTLGQAGKRIHLLSPGNIPVIDSDRGGQVTYHGEGQLIVYTLIDLRRIGLGVRALVSLLENSIIQFLSAQGIDSRARSDAPGVYVGEKKIASVGLRIRHGCSYHGLALNVDMNLEPFSRINTCGYKDLEVTQLSDLGCTLDTAQTAQQLSGIMVQNLHAIHAKNSSE